MLPVAALSMLLMAWWGLNAIRWLAERELDAAGGTRLGVLAGVLGLVNLFALLPALAVGILGLRRGGGAGLLGAAVGVALVGYLVVYFAVCPAQCRSAAQRAPNRRLWSGSGQAKAQARRTSRAIRGYTGAQWASRRKTRSSRWGSRSACAMCINTMCKGGSSR
jgi:hypothetical protein